MGNKEIFAKNLSYYISRTGKTQKELSEIWGIPATTVNDWVRGRRYPKIDKIELLAEYFGIKKSDLIEEKTGADGTDLSPAKRRLIEVAQNCTDREAEKLLAMMQLLLGK